MRDRATKVKTIVHYISHVMIKSSDRCWADYTGGLVMDWPPRWIPELVGVLANEAARMTS